MAIKSALVYGAVRYTVDKGVWADSQATEKLYNELCSVACPQVKKLQKQLPFEVPLMPKTGELCFIAKYYYNQGVKASFNFIHMAPCYMGQWAKKGKDAITSAMEEKPTTAST